MTVEAPPDTASVLTDRQPTSRAESAAGRRPDATRIARLVLVLIGAASVGVVLFVALRRVGSRAEIEWMEGGVADLVDRARAGHSLFDAPSLGSTAYLYPPVFYYVAAAAGLVTGGGLLPLRLVSLASSLAMFVLVGRLVMRLTRDRFAGIVAGTLLAATFGFTGFWYDVGRVDSMCLALTAAGLLLALPVTPPSTRRVAGAAIVMVVAVFTKQEALAAALAVVPAIWRVNARAARRYVSVLLGTLAVAILAMQLATDGWFLYYTATLPFSHEVESRVWTDFWSRDMAVLLPGLLLGVAGLLAVRRRGRVIDLTTGAARGRDRPGARPSDMVLPCVALVVTAWGGRLHSGGWDNVLMPAAVAMAVAAGLGVAVFHINPRPRIALAALGAVALQFVVLWRDPGTQIPRDDASSMVSRFEHDLAELPGPVYMPGHPHYLHAAGCEGSAQSAAISDVLRSGAGPESDQLRADLEGAIADRRFATVIVDSESDLSILPSNFDQYYRFDHDLPGDRRPPMPLTGTKTAPLEVWVPISPS